MSCVCAQLSSATLTTSDTPEGAGGATPHTRARLFDCTGRSIRYTQRNSRARACVVYGVYVPSVCVHACAFVLLCVGVHACTCVRVIRVRARVRACVFLCAWVDG